MVRKDGMKPFGKINLLTKTPPPCRRRCYFRAKHNYSNRPIYQSNPLEPAE